MNIDLLALVKETEADFALNQGEKTEKDIRIFVDKLWYCIPESCLIPFLWEFPQALFPVDKALWTKDPLEHTTFSMLRLIITLHPAKFVAFRLYTLPPAYEAVRKLATADDSEWL